MDNRCTQQEGHPFETVGYLPEMWTVKKDDIYAAIDAIKFGIEYVKMSMLEYNNCQNLDSLKNRTWFQKMESDLRKMEETLEKLRGEPNEKI